MEVWILLWEVCAPVSWGEAHSFLIYKDTRYNTWGKNYTWKRLLSAGKRAGKEHCGCWELERQWTRWMGQEECRPVLPAQRGRRAESQVGCPGVCAWECFSSELMFIFFSSRVQVGLSLLRPRGRVWPDGEAKTSYCQAQVSPFDDVTPAQVQTQSPRKTKCTRWTDWFVFSVRCKESESPHAVTVYMLEPQTCQYILGVSPPEAESIPHCGGNGRKHVHHYLFVSALWTRLNLPSYAGFSTPRTNTDFCRSPANLNKSNGTWRIRRGEDRTDGDGLQLETEDIWCHTQVWLEEQRRPSHQNEGGDVVGLRVWRSTALVRVLMFVYHSQIRRKGLGQSLVLLIFVLNKLIKELRIRGFWNYSGESQTVVPVHACVWRGMRHMLHGDICRWEKGHQH